MRRTLPAAGPQCRSDRSHRRKRKGHAGPSLFPCRSVRRMRGRASLRLLIVREPIPSIRLGGLSRRCQEYASPATGSTPFRPSAPPPSTARSRPELLPVVPKLELANDEEAGDLRSGEVGRVGDPPTTSSLTAFLCFAPPVRASCGLTRCQVGVKGRQDSRSLHDLVADRTAFRMTIVGPRPGDPVGHPTGKSPVNNLLWC